MAGSKNTQARRAMRTRSRLRKLANGRPRLSVDRSHKNISAQIIDDAQGHTIAFASSLEQDFRGTASGIEAATKIGASIAERAKKAGVEEVVFDRGAFIYHGRIKALADAAREGGLKF